MKKIIFTIFVLLLTSCENEILTEIEQEKKCINTNIQSKKRSISEVIEIANKASRTFLGATQTEYKDTNIHNTTAIIAPSTRTTDGDTLLYIINYTDNRGFAVISANRNSDAILAIVEQGSYIQNKQNEGFNMFMEMAEAYAANSCNIIEQNPNIDLIKQYKETFDTIIHIDVKPKISVSWGQTGTEGRYTSNGIAGCANTATAQIMSYFCHPTQIQLNYLGENKRTLNLDWQAMKFHKTTHNNSPCPATLEAHEAISYLHRELGYINNSNYNYNDMTLTDKDMVRIPFYSYGYTISQYIKYNNSDFASLLNENKLIFMIGYYNALEPGHIWVIDGGKKSIITCSSWTCNNGTNIWELLSQSTNIEEYYHINWGFHGDCNGYFNKNVFALNDAIKYDNNNTQYDNNYPIDFSFNLEYFWVTH